MKAATSSLYQYLQNHPAFCPCVIKEPEYFSQNQNHGIRSRGIQVANYRDLWKFDESHHRYALEASTGYSQFPKEPQVAKDIFDYGLRPKFIYILRDPIERISSHRNFIRNKSRAKTVTLEHMIAVSNYYLQLEQYRKFFPRQNFLLLDFDEVTNDPVSSVNKVLRFLGLPGNYNVGTFAIHNATRHESRLEKQLRRSVLKSFFRLVPKSVRARGNKLLERLPSEIDTLSSHEKHLIHSALYKDMLRLQRTYGIDVSKWGYQRLEQEDDSLSLKAPSTY